MKTTKYNNEGEGDSLVLSWCCGECVMPLETWHALGNIRHPLKTKRHAGEYASPSTNTSLYSQTSVLHPDYLESFYLYLHKFLSRFVALQA